MLDIIKVRSEAFNRLLTVIILMAFVVLGLAIYTTFGGSKQNLSNAFLPYYGELFDYEFLPRKEKFKFVSSVNNSSAIDLPDKPIIKTTKSSDSSNILISAYNQDNPLPAQSQVWNLVNSSKSIDLQVNQFWFWEGSSLKRLEFESSIADKHSKILPSSIRATTEKDLVRLEQINLETELQKDVLDINLTSVEHWPENNQIWLLYKINGNKSLAIGWNVTSGKIISKFVVPQSKSISFSEDLKTLIFTPQNGANILFYSIEGLNKDKESTNQNSSQEGKKNYKIDRIEHFQDKNYILSEETESVPVNLSKLSNLEKTVYKAEVWNKDFSKIIKIIKTNHTKEIAFIAPIQNTNFVLTAGKDNLVTILNLDEGKTLEQHLVSKAKSNSFIVGGYLDNVSNQLVLIYKNGDINFYQMLK